MAYRTPGVPGPHQSTIPSNLPVNRFAHRDHPNNIPGAPGVSDFYPAIPGARRLGEAMPVVDRRPARGYGQDVVSRGSGMRGLGATQYMSSDLDAKKVEAQGVLSGVSTSTSSLTAAVKSAQGYAGDPNVGPVLDQATALVAKLQNDVNTLQQAASVPTPAPVPQNIAPVTAAWNAINAAESAVKDDLGAIPSLILNLNTAVRSAQAAAQTARVAQASAQQQADQQTVQNARTQALSLMNAGNFDGASAALTAQVVTAAAGRLGYDLSADLNAIAAARAKATSSASASADNATVQRARSSALALMNQGNFAGALAALQSQNVTDAANRIGYDLSPDIAAVTGAQQQAGKTEAAQTAAQKAQSDCAAAGGTWNGFTCDMTAVKAQQAASAASDKVDAAIAQANTLAAGGSYRAAIAVLSGASRAAQISDRQGDVGAAVASIQDQQNQASCAARGGTWDGNTCTMPAPPPPPPPPPPPAPPPQDPSIACAAAGGTWNGTTCVPAPAPPPAWIAQLLPQIFQAPAASPASAAVVSSGPSPQQLEALAILQAFGGPQGQSLAQALQGALAPQPPFSAAPQGAPDGTPCAQPDGSAGVFQGGDCRTVAPPSGLLYGAPQARETF